MAFGGHARVDEDLRHRVLRRGRFLAQVRLAQRIDVVDRVVVADELEGVGYRLDEVFFADGGHGCSLNGPASFGTNASDRRTRRRDPRSDFPTKNFTIPGPWEFPREIHDPRRLVRGEMLAAESEER